MGVIALTHVMQLNNREKQRLRYLALATAVLVLAAGLRLGGLAETPPGLHHDEAFHLLSARAIVDGAGVPVYITGNQGNEPMFAYLASLALRLVGPAPWAGRLAAAMVGVLSVALTLRAGQEMFPRRSVGLWAAMALAVLYWHLSISRWGSQPILAAAAGAGTLLGLWRGTRTGAWWAYALAGASLAFGLWAYVAFRVFPAVPLAAGLALLAAQRAPRGRLLAGGLVAAGTALLLYAPLGLYFVQHPEWFFNRYNQISVSAPGTVDSPLARLLSHAVDVGAGLFLPGRGDLDWRQNLSGRPAFDLVQVVVFASGCLAALRRWRSPETVALAVWVLVGLAPAVLTEFPPQFGRTVMVTPALALLLGLGAEALWAWGRGGPWARLTLALALVGSAGLTVRDYFGRWANDDHLFIAFDTGLHRVAQGLRQADPGTTLYETPVYREYPTLEYTLGPDAYGRFRAFNGRACTVLPAVTRAPVTYGVILAEDARTVPALQAAFPAGRLRSGPSMAGAPYAAFFDIPAGETAQLGGSAASAEFGEWLGLRRFRMEGDHLAPGELLGLTLTWELKKATPAALTSFLHLIGPAREDGSIVYAQRDSQPCDNAYPTWQWQPGELLVDYLTLPLPEDLPAGRYAVNVGWYDGETQERLPLTGPGAGPEASSGSYPVGTLVVAP